MEKVGMVNDKFSLTNQRGFLREEKNGKGRVFYVLEASQSVIIGQDMLTKEVKVFKSNERPDIYWL